MADPLTLAVAAMAAGTAVSASGTLAAGASARQAADFQAKQAEQQGRTEQAQASRAAMESARQSRLAQSSAQARSAASGGGVADDLIGDIAEEGEYRTLSALWAGNEALAGRQTQAAGYRFTGADRQRAARISAVGTLISGGGQTLMAKYG